MRVRYLLITYKLNFVITIASYISWNKSGNWITTKNYFSYVLSIYKMQIQFQNNYADHVKHIAKENIISVVNIYCIHV